MNHFVVTRSRDTERLKQSFSPFSYAEIPCHDLTTDELFVYCVDILDDLYRGKNVVVHNINHSIIRKLFDIVNKSEIDELSTVYIDTEDDVGFLRSVHVDSIIIWG